MAISFEPGDEICLDVPSKRKFYTTAKSYREQKKLSTEIADIRNEAEESTEEQRLDKALEFIAANVTRTEPPIQISVDALADVLDVRLIYSLVSAIRFNSVTEDEKKS